MNSVNYFELLKLAMPETIMVVTVLAVLAADLVALRGVETNFRRIIGAMIAGVGCVAAIGWLLLTPATARVEVLGGMLVVDPVIQFVKIALLVLTIFTVLLSVDSNFTTHISEYLTLILLGAIGMMFLVSAEDALMIFIALELTSLSLYILTAFNKRDVRSAEAALKYFLFGGMSAAFTLFGLSLLYGLTGATNLREIAAALAGKGLDPLLIVAMIMVIVGFGFKVAAVPFHLWAPDAYQGAPTPSAAFIASGSKVASFFIFAKVMQLGFAGAEGSGAWRNFVSGWIPAIAIVAALSMVVGNLVAIVQGNVKRLIAYSAIAHAGYALLAILNVQKIGISSLLYYVTTYGLTTIGAFGVVAVVEKYSGDARLTNFAGLSRRAPVVSFCMMIFMLSLAGIPPLAGFFGKFFVFTAVVASHPADMGMLWLVILAIGMSAVSLYYYLQVLKQIYIVAPAVDVEAMRVPVVTQVVLAVLAAGVIWFGCAPGQLISVIQDALKVVSA